MDEHEHRIERLDRFQETVSRAGELVSSLEKLSAQAGDVVSKVTEAAACQGDTIGKLAVETSRTAQQKVLQASGTALKTSLLLYANWPGFATAPLVRKAAPPCRMQLEEAEERAARGAKVRKQIDELRTYLDRSRRRAGVARDQVRQAVDVGLRLSGGKALELIRPEHQDQPALYAIGVEGTALAQDQTWVPAIGTAKLGDWPVEIGLWVGRDRMGYKGDNDARGQTAQRKLISYKNNTKRPTPVPIKTCPWCARRSTRTAFILSRTTTSRKTSSCVASIARAISIYRNGRCRS